MVRSIGRLMVSTAGLAVWAAVLLHGSCRSYLVYPEFRKGFLTTNSELRVCAILISLWILVVPSCRLGLSIFPGSSSTSVRIKLLP